MSPPVSVSAQQKLYIGSLDTKKPTFLTKKVQGIFWRKKKKKKKRQQNELLLLAGEKKMSRQKEQEDA